MTCRQGMIVLPATRIDDLSCLESKTPPGAGAYRAHDLSGRASPLGLRRRRRAGGGDALVPPREFEVLLARRLLPPPGGVPVHVGEILFHARPRLGVIRGGDVPV